MTPWLLSIAVLVAAFAVLAGTGGLSVRRSSGSHVVAHLAIAGRGLYVSRTPTGRGGDCACDLAGAAAKTRVRGVSHRPTAASGSRADRWGRGPIAGAVELNPPREQT